MKKRWDELEAKKIKRTLVNSGFTQEHVDQVMQQLMSDLAENRLPQKLPPGWERKTAPDGRAYYFGE